MPNADELNTWTKKLGRQAEHGSAIADVATDQQTDGSQATLVIDRVTASRLGITPLAIDNALYDAFGQRQISRSLPNSISITLSWKRCPDFQKNPANAEDIYVHSTQRRRRARSALSRTLNRAPQRSAINHQGQFPVVTISFNLAPRAVARRCDESRSKSAKKN